jgi:hypothetical protein
MRELALSELHLLSDAQLERVIARCADLRAHHARFQMSELRRRGQTRNEPDEPLSATSVYMRQRLELERINRLILDETAKLERYGAGLLGRLGVFKTLSFAGRRFSLAAAPIIDRIESHYRKRRELEALLASKPPVAERPRVSPDSDLSEYIIRLRLNGTYVLLDLRLKPTSAVRKIQRERENARKTAEIQRLRAQDARKRERDGRASRSKRGRGRGKGKMGAADAPAKTSVKPTVRRKEAPHPPVRSHELAPLPAVAGPGTPRLPQPPARERLGTTRGSGRRDADFLRSKVYVLALEHGKFYVGRCTNFPLRVKYHIEGRGAGWTRMYRPIASHAFFWGAEEEEKAVTLHYMDVFGLDNVRGWVFAKAGDYDEEAVDSILRECSPPIPIELLAVCEALVPMPLEHSPLWELNRHREGHTAIFRDEGAW